MGWCSGTEIFDSVVEILLTDNINTEEAIQRLVISLENMDRDCQFDSEYANHPIVQKVFKKLHPRWYDDDN